MKVDREVLREGQAESRRDMERPMDGAVAGGAEGQKEGEGTWCRPGSRVPSGFRRRRPVSLFSWLSTELFASRDS